jgi:uncharacterized membrane protein
MNTAIRTGTALAITVGIAYALCAIAFGLWPEAAATVMNGLFHGLDFRKLQSGPTLFSFGSFFVTLLVLMIWAFGVGALFDLARGWVGGTR